MDQKDLIKISLIISIVGILIIYIMALVIEPPLVNISDLNKEFIGKHVKVCGEISSQYTSEKGTVFLKLSDNDELKAVIFKETAEGLDAYNLKIGEGVCVEGNIEFYKDSLEIIVSKFERK